MATPPSFPDEVIMSADPTDSTRELPIDHQHYTRTIFDEPGVFTPVKDLQNDVMFIKSEPCVIPCNTVSKRVKKRKKRRASAGPRSKARKAISTVQSSPPEELRSEISPEDSPPPGLDLLPSEHLSSQEVSDTDSTATLPLENRDRCVELIDLTLSLSETEEEVVPTQNERSGVSTLVDEETEEEVVPTQNERSGVSTLVDEEATVTESSIETQVTAPLEATIQSALPDEDEPGGLAFVNLGVTMDTMDDTTGNRQESGCESNFVEGPLGSEMLDEANDTTSSNQDHVSDDSHSMETLDNVPVLEVNNIVGEDTSSVSTQDSGISIDEALQGNLDGLVDFDIESAFLAVQGNNQYIPLSVSFEYLEAEETKLREQANNLKAIVMPLDPRRKSIVQQREYLKGKLEKQQADSISKSDALVAIANKIAASSMEIHAIKDKQSQLASDSSKADIELLQMRVDLAELQADIYRNHIEIQKDASLNDSLMNNITAKQEKLKQISDGIITQEALKVQLSSAMQELSNKLKRYSHEECILRRKMEELKVQHQASIALVHESKAKFADATKRLEDLNEQYNAFTLQFEVLESRMTSVMMCRKQKRLQERIRTSLNLVLGGRLRRPFRPLSVLPDGSNE